MKTDTDVELEKGEQGESENRGELPVGRTKPNQI